MRQLLSHPLFYFLSFAISLLFSLNAYADSVNSLLRQPNDPIAGNPKGAVTLVEFFDYQCSHCVIMSPIVASLIKSNPNLRVVFKEFPIRGPLSDFASRAALAANKQEKYLPFHDALMNANQPFTQDSILTIAKEVGLNLKKLKEDIKSQGVSNQLASNFRLAERLQLTGTPAFFVGKTNAKNNADIRYLLGEVSQSELQDAINEVEK